MLTKANSQIIKNVIQQRYMSVVATPAWNKVFKASLMVAGWLAITAWVLLNIKYYHDKE